MQLKPSIRSTLLLGALFFSLVTTSIAQLPGPCGDEICPGRIRNPDGRQYFMGAAFNAEHDEYLLTYSNGGPLALRLGPDGNVIGNEIVIGPNTTVQETVIALNPERNEYLIVYRNDSPTEIFARYLDGNGQPLGDAFFISNGVDPKIAFSSLHDRYMVTFTRYLSGTPGIRFQMVEGDSTAPSKLIGGQVVVASNAVTVRVAYGSVSDKFLIAYGKEFGGAEKGGVIGHFVTGDGSSVGGTIDIGVGKENQGNAEIAYASSRDRWLVSMDDWNTGGGFPKISAHFVDSDETVSARMNLTPGDPDWDVPGPITYVKSADVFVATWFVAVWARARTVDPLDGTIGDVIDVSRLNGFPTAATARTHSEEPQALILSRSGYGLDGVHAHIVEMPPAPPQSDIKANSSDGPITIATSDLLSMEITLNCNSQCSENADWWLLADTPFGWYRYDGGGDTWVPGQVVTYQGPLVDLSPYQVMNRTLPAGSYTFYFGVDLLMNGSIDLGQSYYDSVEVTVTPAP